MIAGAVPVGAWLIVETNVWLFKPAGFLSRLSSRDWVFLAHVALVLLYVLLGALGVIHLK